jgi:hypothetical protein
MATDASIVYGEYSSLSGMCRVEVLDLETLGSLSSEGFE